MCLSRLMFVFSCGLDLSSVKSVRVQYSLCCLGMIADERQD